MIVMAGLVPAIHDFLVVAKTWMPGTRPGMTIEYVATAAAYAASSVVLKSAGRMTSSNSTSSE